MGEGGRKLESNLGAESSSLADAGLQQGSSNEDSEVGQLRIYFGSEMLGIDHGLNVGMAGRPSRMTPRILAGLNGR